MNTNSRTRGYILHSCVAAVLSSLSLVAVNSVLKFSSGSPKQSTAPNRARTLSFVERVAYQRAIEGVYWRHRILPKEHPDSKPSLDVVMSQAQLENKVADYLGKSQVLEDHWQRPITVEQLQAEMDRMAKNTKRPEMLRELFEALGNDPFVIAECLARPALAERNLAIVAPRTHRREASQARVKAPKHNVAYAPSANYTLPAISNGPNGCTDDTWAATTTTNAPTRRLGPTSVWTGNEMIVWGGYAAPPPQYFNTGGRYNPATNSWTSTNTTNAPSARVSHTAVWTGSEMIIWGGGTGSPSVSNTGGRYNPVSDSWIATSIINAPAAREYHTAVWTGTEMIIWGGWNGPYFNTGGRYNPATDTWTATSTTNAPTGRYGHTAVWTGSEMIIWGGYFYDGSQHYINTGGRYDPGTDSWTATSTATAPTGREYHTAVWTGDEMIVWGGSGATGFLNSGGRYNPSTDSWTATNPTNPPSPRDLQTAVWTGNEMIVWGGYSGGSDVNASGAQEEQFAAPTATADAGAVPQPSPSATIIDSPTPTATATPTSTPGPGTGGRYDPDMDTWTATTRTNAPSARYYHTAVWTGSEMIIWGGNDVLGNMLQTGGRYCAQLPAPTPTPTATATLPPSPTPTATVRSSPAPRARPTPAPRP